jgi:hypothetical protein
MSDALPAIERPNGKLYRPRKVDAVGLGNEDEITHILVFGTHNKDFAEAHAAPDLERLSDEFYYSDFRLQISGPGKQGWYRRDLAGFEDDAPIYVFAEDPKTGRAGVMFPVDEVKVER